MNENSHPIPVGYEQCELIVRHPDFADEVTLYGLSHRIIYLDLGSSFDMSKLDPGISDLERESIEEWTEGVRSEVADLPKDHPARLAVESQLRDILTLIATDDDPDYGGLR